MSPSLVARVLADPSLVNGLSLPQWDLLIRQARLSDVLARLHERLRQTRLLDAVPDAPRRHLGAAHAMAQTQHADVRREIDAIARALAPADVPVVLLKGAAYVMAGLPAAMGRSMSDIDILVPHRALAEVESCLMLAGWNTTHHDEYDQRYYRQWMHELPPMVNAQRGTAIDVHHAILPLTARFKPDSRLLLRAAVPIDGHPGLFTLAPADRVLHSMTHLLCNEELSHGLRDLSDIDLLLRAEADRDDFWNSLVQRAVDLDLGPMLLHGLLACGALLGTPIPGAVVEQARRRCGVGPTAERWLQALWRRALDCPHWETRDPWAGAALSLLYARAHWMRMPPALVIRHLSTKLWRRLSDAASPGAPNTA